MADTEKSEKELQTRPEGKWPWLVALLASSLLHGGLVVNLERGEIAERIKVVLSDTVHFVDQASDFLRPAKRFFIV